MQRSVVAFLAFAAPVLAEPGEALYPAAQCAAFWLGRDDYARASAYLDRDPDDPGRAARFRAAALRLNGDDAAPVDAFIAEQRPLMALMMDAVVFGQDRPSRDLHDRLLLTCDAFSAGQPEFQGR